MTNAEIDTTLITISLGRPSLTQVARDLENQTYKNFKWLVGFDAKGEIERGISILETTALRIEYCTLLHKNESHHFEMLAEISKRVKTPFVMLIDDDNRFEPNHVEVIRAALLQGCGFAASHRTYCDDDFNIIAHEHAWAELVDTNNMGINTNLFKDAMQFLKTQWLHDKQVYADRHLQAYLFSRGINAVRVPYTTVQYKVNAKNCPFDYIRDYDIIELITNRVIRIPRAKDD